MRITDPDPSGAKKKYGAMTTSTPRIREMEKEKERGKDSSRGAVISVGNTVARSDSARREKEIPMASAEAKGIAITVERQAMSREIAPVGKGDTSARTREKPGEKGQ